MDYKPRQSYKGNSYTYKKKRIFWFNSAFNDDFTLVDGKIDDITFNVPPFQTYNQNNLKLLTFVREDTNPKPIIIKLKEPYLVSRSVVNTDKESYPIIYANHTGNEGMTTKGNNFSLTPQQIPKFVFKFDDTINKLTYNSYFSSVVNGSLFQASGSPDDKYIVFNSSGSFVLSRNLVCDILIVGGGGGGGSRHAGGGGAGALIYETNKNLNSGTYTISIGAGGNGGISNANGTNGGDTSISLSGTNIYLAKGGGGGNGVNGAGLAGGSSGGSAGDSSANTAPVSTNIPSGTYGNAGGGGTNGGSAPTFVGYSGGGGGGAGEAGGNSIKDTNGKATGGLGGNGKLILITGSPIYYAGGGGGGVSAFGNSSGSGGLGGGGAGSKGSSTASSGINGLGGGGGGGGFNDGANGNGGAGGSGVVIIRFRETRISGMTANETLVQATNSSIPVVENSKYQINYQNPINIPTGTYETIFSNGNIYLSNKKFPRPWGAYFADDWSGTTLLDSSGNNRHATTAGTITKTTAFGNGANAPITYISGGSSASITFPAGSLATNWTILSLIRISNSANTASSFFTANTGENFVIGYYYGNRGVGYLGNSFDNTNIGNKTDWLNYIIKNSNTTNNVLVDGIQKTISGTFGNSRLSINNGFYPSDDWVLSAIIIWDSHLTNSQMIELNTLVENFKQTGRSLKNDLWLSNDRSYPILKDANGDTINPLAWYKFDTSNNLGLDDMGVNNLSNPNGVAFSTDFVKGGGSASFDGVNDSLDSNISFNLNSKDFSISVWMKKTDNSRVDWVLSLGGDSTTFYTLLEIGYVGDNRIRFGFYGNELNTANTYNDAGVWTHLVFTYKTGLKNRKIYRNGVEVGSDTAGNELTTNLVLRIGRKYTSEYSKCLMDDLRIYQTTLSATQVSELYNGRVSIYNPPNFEIGLELEDTNLVLDNTISPYK